MKALLWSRLLALYFSILTQTVTANPQYGGGPGINSSTSTSGNSSSSSNATSSGTVATACFTDMCIAGSVNGSNVQYELSATGASTPGWMAIGFGSQMAGSPMVIFWSNSDGSITMSQREASGHVMPTVVSNPTRVASLVNGLSSSTGSIKYTFIIPSDGNTSPNLIWAYSTTNPGSSSSDANMDIHTAEGVTQLNLAEGGEAGSIPLTKPEKYFIAHAILCVVGFLLFLPIGGLLARYFRTFTNAWCRLHWIIQLLGGVIIIVGVALGIQGVEELGGKHLDDYHQKLGISIFVLYFAQVILGFFIHKIKLGKPGRRPPQNYFHVVLGLTIIGLAMAQVRNGYRVEWPRVSGRGPVANGANVIWYIWVVLLPVLYLIGLAFLPKQFKQEAASRQNLKATHQSYTD
ncbi:hypothetical protein V5O48_018280 [Marasmius crinis-equi]|uniref:CBD9-like protein n=1 Tax=Marasmius crinis-equi TaxID=585013 RepID=A0ABR3ELQ2_9AGAR